MAEARELSLEALYDQHASALYRFALALLGSSDDAEDAVQEVFVEAGAPSKNRLDRIDDPKRYLFTSIRNSAYGILRSKRRRDVLHDAITAELSADEPDGPRIFRSSGKRCLGAFAGLPVDQREVLALKVFEEMTFAEIAPRSAFRPTRPRAAIATGSRS